ncbi:hypothetical protein [Burkholderia lata]|uniref:glycine-rich domain-containing protein n=1 Tax=Burkholderia lata (strain ATCC 17760 / DSM 23089 / LMG 22485 / NCIMB 9086 / R18194 / 383) TaxID=482957 RepID=UPI001453A0B1|nr:hypothetical protein [Burkholderia lata]VWB67328.1 hypothetical protein BLA15816_03188 [Burkholderia lata]
MANIIGTIPANLQNGTNADASQVMADLNFIVNQVNANATPVGTISPGSFLGVQIFKLSGSYTPTAGATKAIVEAVGGGGGGGAAAATNSAQWSCGGGGSSGSYGKIYISSGLTAQTVTVGAGGTGAVGANGSAGGQTSFGALLVCPGGPGGGQSATGGAGGPGIFVAQAAAATAPSGSGLFLVSTTGGSGLASFALPNYTIGGDGGSNPIGQGGSGNFGSPATGYGAGGAGANNFASQPAHAGLNGAGGVVFVFEFE